MHTCVKTLTNSQLYLHKKKETYLYAEKIQPAILHIQPCLLSMTLDQFTARLSFICIVREKITNNRENERMHVATRNKLHQATNQLRHNYPTRPSRPDWTELKSATVLSLSLSLFSPSPPLLFGAPAENCAPISALPSPTACQVYLSVMPPRRQTGVLTRERERERISLSSAVRRFIGSLSVARKKGSVAATCIFPMQKIRLSIYMW